MLLGCPASGPRRSARYAHGVVDAPPHVVHIVATTKFAGVERYITYVAPGLVDAGFRVTVIGGDEVLMRSVLDPAGVTHLSYQSLRRAGAAIRRLDADVVHAHMTSAELTAVLGARRHTKIVSTRHFATRRGSRWSTRTVDRLVRTRLHQQISISQFVADEIGQPSLVIPNGVPDQPAGRHDERIVLACQRLEDEKRTDVAVRAWARSGLARQGWTLQIAGTGAELDTLRALADSLGVANSVEFLGFVEDSVERMARAALYLATAPAEPFGLGVAEAMSTGAAVVAAAGGAHLELLEAASDATFAPGDVDGAARTLRAWCERTAADRLQAGALLQQRQRHDFSAAEHIQRLAEVYRRLLQRAAPTSPVR